MSSRSKRILGMLKEQKTTPQNNDLHSNITGK